MGRTSGVTMTGIGTPWTDYLYNIEYFKSALQNTGRIYRVSSDEVRRRNPEVLVLG